MTGARREFWTRLPISPSISSGSSNGERVRISVVKVIDYAPNCYADGSEFIIVKGHVIIVHSHSLLQCSELCLIPNIGTRPARALSACAWKTFVRNAWVLSQTRRCNEPSAT